MRGANVLLMTVERSGGIAWAPTATGRPHPEHRSDCVGRRPLRPRVYDGAADTAGARIDPDRPSATDTAFTTTRDSGSTTTCRRLRRHEAGGYRNGCVRGRVRARSRFGLNRGFDEDHDRLPHADRASFHFSERRAADVVGLAGDWILAGGSASGARARRQRLAPKPKPWPPVPGSPGSTSSIRMHLTTPLANTEVGERLTMPKSHTPTR